MVPDEDKNRPSTEARGDAESEFCREETTRLLAAVSRYRLQREEAQEIVQEAWLADYRRQRTNGPFGSKEEEHRWLMTAVRHLAIDVHRRNKRVVQALDALPMEPIDRREAQRVAAAARNECLYAVLNRLRQTSEVNHWLLCQRYWHKRSIRKLAE